jgi:hypothetical protein
MVMLGYYVLKDLDFLPPCLGGSGDFDNLYFQWSTWTKPKNFDLLFFIMSGYHIEALASQIFKERSNDYIEMMLHHVVTLNLIIISYLTHFDKFGVLLIWLHNISDIFASSSRSLGYSFSIATVISYILLMSTWFYTRVYVFFYIVLSVYTTKMTID